MKKSKRRSHCYCLQSKLSRRRAKMSNSHCRELNLRASDLTPVDFEFTRLRQRHLAAASNFEDQRPAACCRGPTERFALLASEGARLS